MGDCTCSALKFVRSSTKEPAIALLIMQICPHLCQVLQTSLGIRMLTFHLKARPDLSLIQNITEVSSSPVVCDTFFANPVPQQSFIELNYVAACSTLLSHSYLFKVITPINVNEFQALLMSHPNQTFVHSVCHVLQNGFWPWAETINEAYPTTSDHPNRPSQSDHHLNFITNQFHEEEACSCLSPSFEGELLPGMYSVPVHTMPKP